MCRAFRFEVKLNTNARRHANTAHEVSCVRVWTFFVNLNAVLASQALGRAYVALPSVASIIAKHADNLTLEENDPQPALPIPTPAPPSAPAPIALGVWGAAAGAPPRLPPPSSDQLLLTGADAAPIGGEPPLAAGGGGGGG